jgi:hypothetical protein
MEHECLLQCSQELAIALFCKANEFSSQSHKIHFDIILSDSSHFPRFYPVMSSNQNYACIAVL